MSQLSFSIAGVPFALHAQGSEALLLPENFDEFRVSFSDPHPAARYEVLAPSAKLELFDGDVVWDCPTWQMVRAGEHLQIQIRIVPNESLVPVATTTADFSSAELTRHAGRKGAASPFALNYPCDQALVISRLAFFDTCVLHACGVAYRDRIFLFSGRSGIGKTTLGRLWRNAGAQLLNDDRMAVRATTDGVFASATPWHGEEKAIREERLPLGGIFFLHQDAENVVEDTGSAEALSLLTANTIAPFYLPDVVERITSTWSSVLATVPAYHFRFRPTADAVETCLAQVCSPTR